MVSTRSVSTKTPWVSLGYSVAFIFRYPKLLSVSLLLVGLTALLTWIGAHFTLGLVDSFTGNFFVQPPAADHFWKYPLVWGWYLLDWVFLFISRIIVLYLAFLLPTV